MKGDSSIWELFREVNIPYEMRSNNPWSKEYYSEVLDIYKSLTDSDYSVSNEITSILQDPKEFEVGFPWMTNNLSIIASEYAKPLQVMRILSKRKGAGSKVIEFGAGWGNLALPLLRAGIDVTVVDIDRAFIDRMVKQAAKVGIERLKYRCGDFMAVAVTEQERYDTVIFQSSFHHCLDFYDLIGAVRKLLSTAGGVVFVNEPILKDLKFPWGLRYDGEALWAIMCNKWLELGFHWDFFVEMLMRNQLLPSLIPAIPGFYGEGIYASLSNEGINFSDLLLPNKHGSSFHDADGMTQGRFTQGCSSLPALSSHQQYKLHFRNFRSCSIRFSVVGSDLSSNLSLESGQSIIVTVSGGEDDIKILSETFCPDDEIRNGDKRVLGVYLEYLSIHEKDGRCL